MGQSVGLQGPEDRQVGQRDYFYKINRRGSMRATIHPSAIILTKAHRAAVSMMAEGCIAV